MSGERGIFKTSGRYSQTLRDLLTEKDKLDKQSLNKTYYKNYQDQINNDTHADEANVYVKNLAENKQYQRYTGELEVDRLKSLLDLQIYIYDEPDLIESSIKEIESAMNKVKHPPIMKFVKEAGIDSYELAREIYLRLSEGQPRGKKIKLGTLLKEVEIVTQNAIDIGMSQHDKKKPFFF